MHLNVPVDDLSFKPLSPEANLTETIAKPFKNTRFCTAIGHPKLLDTEMQRNWEITSLYYFPKKTCKTVIKSNSSTSKTPLPLA